MLALTALTPARAQAQAAQSSVQTYAATATSAADTEGVLPEGMKWNEPLKAGDMVLPRLPEEKTPPQPSTTQRPTLPVGALKAPQLRKNALPPTLTSNATSSANVMLMQGMKSALQQAGQNPDIPPSSASGDALPTQPVGEGALLAPNLQAAASPESATDDSNSVSDSKTSAPSESQMEAKAGSKGEPQAESGTANGLKYEPGQAPKSLDSYRNNGKGALTDTALPSPDRSLAPSLEAGLPGMDIPKATDLLQEPSPLDGESAKGDAAASSETMAALPEATKGPSNGVSILGPAVAPGQDSDKEESSKEETAQPKSSSEKADSSKNSSKLPAPSSGLAIPPDTDLPAPAKTCEPKVVAWTKTCEQAGYAATFSGEIKGETRTECPDGSIRDVWLSNTCAESGAGSGATESSTEKTSATPAPKDSATPKNAAKDSLKETSPKESKEPKESLTQRVDANCGAANGMAVDRKPLSDLCAAGNASIVTGDGPWRWSCHGFNGGMTVSCAAPVSKTSSKETKGAKDLNAKSASTETGAVDSTTPQDGPQDGKCGTSNDQGYSDAPSDNLCDKGLPSRVNGGGPWTWACSGTNGGQAAACKAQRKVDGACGTANGSGAGAMPERDLCTAGYASAVTGDGPWSWTCSGLYGGTAATCAAAPKINAVCGAASLTGHKETPKDDLCKAGAPTEIEGDGPWTWLCEGEQGGASVPCKALVLVDGACGTANGKAFTAAPEEDLCDKGHATRVTGLGPWNWNCAGLEGGETVSCTASLGAENKTEGKAPACGSAGQRPALTAPVAGLCDGGKPSAVGGQGPWTWSCSDDAGQSVACTAPQATEGACGTASNVPSAHAPTDRLCESGTPGTVTSDKTKTHWSWNCVGSSSATTVSCSAPVLRKAQDSAALCGLAAERGTTSAPHADLCAQGKATSVRGKGPWTWTCANKSGHKVACEAPKIVDGACGSANGSIQNALPLTGLCAQGAPTEVNGNGPWLWSCVGAGGGQSVSCSAASQAQAKVDGACGAAANAVMTHAPETNLCDSGSASAVSGQGPWAWTCSGYNGGIASTCATAKVLPKAPPPPGPAINANCGPANGVAAIEQPEEGLCSAGTATDVSGNGPWNWNCLGLNGGMTVSCTAPLVPPAPIVGACGPAHGVTTLVAPKSGLCSAGIASAVNGKGPWTWSCSGTNGGGAVSCVAPMAGQSEQPLPSAVTPGAAVDDAEQAPAPAAAPVGLVTPRLPTGALPPLETGSLPQLQPSKPLATQTAKTGKKTSKSSKKAASKTASKTQPKTETTVLPPESEPTLPSGQPSLTAPPIRDDVAPEASVKPPNVDQDGKIVIGGRLVLDPDLTTLSFERGSDIITSDSAKLLDRLAAVLQEHSAVRLTLNAYAATDGDTTPRIARRISLSRALGVRDYLTNKGISSSRIDVRALGANVPSGDMDRVDIKVNP